ncbi:MAG: ATP-binding protein [Clostridia bacterium]|nr:ATP-binding protein [Clostridia bacterium]
MYSRENFDKVKARFSEKARRAEEEARERARRAEEKNPELHRLGLLIRATAVRVLEESMKGGDDLADRVKAIGRETLRRQEEYAAELRKMGLPADYTKPRFECALCEDTGIVEGKMCTCMKREVVLEGYRASGIGKLLEKQRFDNFDLSYYSHVLLPDKPYSPRDVMTSIFQEMRDWAENFSPETSPSLLFIGGTGLGKTHLSTAIAGKVIEKGFDVVYESAPAVASLFEKDRFGKDEAVSEKLRRIFEAELLILDDLGTEPTSQTTSSAFYQLINTRASVMGLPTIISTNLTHHQLEKQYDTATLSRLLGDFKVKLFLGSDVRRAKLSM